MDTQIIVTIWRKTLVPYRTRWSATIDRNHDDYFTEHRNPTRFEESPGKDMFFAPLSFDGDRNNENARGFTILFADLDNVRDHKDPLHKFWPHIMWMTSNENAQAVWFLDAEMPSHSAWADLNQRMTYFMGADKGGWHASKLLRVPGSKNWKYDPPQQGTTVTFQPKAAPYEAEALLNDLPQIQASGPKLVSECPNPIPASEWKAHLAKFWNDIPMITRHDLTRASVQDRSDMLVRVANKLRKAGLEPGDIFQALWWVEWNKFRTDRHRPDILWDLVNYR